MKTLAATRLSIEDLLNGRYGLAQALFIAALIQKWNTKLGCAFFRVDAVRALGQQHDFADLARHLELVDALEPIFVGAKQFEDAYKARLTPTQQQCLRQAIQHLAATYQSLVDGFSAEHPPI